jgi:hypothetical protein
MGAPDASTQELSPMAHPPMVTAESNDLTPAGSNFHYPFEAPRHLMDAMGHYHHHMRRDCPHCKSGNSTPGFRDHFIHCCGMSKDNAELWGHALMHAVLLAGRRV